MAKSNEHISIAQAQALEKKISNDKRMSIAKAQALENQYGNNLVKQMLNLDNGIENSEEETIINNTITAADSIKNRYGIRQQIITLNENEDSYVKAMRILMDNCKPKEDIEVECIGDLDYRIGFGVHVQIPFLSQYTDCLMYVKSVDHQWKPNGMFISKLVLTPSRVMDEQDWSDTTDSDDSDYTGGSADSEIAGNIIKLLKQQLGKPYVWGATGPDTFDCSGLMMYCFNKYSNETGITITRTTYTQVKQGKTVDKDNKDEWCEGDLIFFTGDGSYQAPSHVACYLGNNKMIHAPQAGDVVKIVEVSRTDIYEVRRIIPEVSTDTASSIDTVGSKNSKYASSELIKFTESKEKFSSTVYDDGYGTLTIGYGSTSNVSSILGFDPIQKGSCTKAEAEEWLIKIMNFNGANLSIALLKAKVSLVQNKLDALLDYCYWRPYWFENKNHILWQLIYGKVNAEEAWLKAWNMTIISTSGHKTRALHLANMWTKGTYTKGY